MIDCKVTLKKLGNVSLCRAMVSLHANEIYAARDNPLTRTLLYKGDLVCTFEGIYSYSFDQEHCQFQLYLFCKANFQTLVFLYNMINYTR